MKKVTWGTAKANRQLRMSHVVHLLIQERPELHNFENIRDTTRAGNSVYLGNRVTSQKTLRSQKPKKNGKKEEEWIEKKKRRWVRRIDRGKSRKNG